MDILIIDPGMIDASPVRLFHFQPGLERAQTPVQHPGRFFLTRGDHPDRVGCQAFRRDIHLDVRLEAPFITGLRDGTDGVECLVNG